MGFCDGQSSQQARVAFPREKLTRRPWPEISNAKKGRFIVRARDKGMLSGLLLSNEMASHGHFSFNGMNREAGSGVRC